MPPLPVFAAPWILAALPLVLLLPRGRGRAWRAAALALLIVALARPELRLPGGELAVLIDVSESAGGAARAAAERATAGLDAPVRWYLFAGETARVDGPDAPAPAGLEPGATDLARALQVAAAAGADRILVASDGRASRGDALASLPAAPVDALPVPAVANARVAALLAPTRAAPGETVELSAVVETDRPTRGVLRATAGGAELPPVELDLPAGRTVVPLRFVAQAGDASEADGGVPASARLEVGYAQPGRDDTAEAVVSIGEREPALVLGDPAAARLLRAQGIDVVEGGAEDVRAPMEWSAVVLRDSAAAFTPGQLELLRDYVFDGGGLMMTGGPDSFGLGAWYRTPVEDALPVTTDLRTQLDVPLVALVIVLDRSQSMAAGRPSRLELAKDGAIGVIDLAYEDDLLGMIAFSDPASTEWVFEPRPATERGKREMLAAVLRLSTTGGTVLGPAYGMALERLAATDASVKHVIILSDGRLYDGQGPFGGQATDFAAMAAQAATQARITTSTIAIGEEADFGRMRAIAAAGGGRYYEALDVSTLPRVFTTEALTATRSLVREDPAAASLRPHPLIPEGASDPPAPDAYVATSPKPDAEVLVVGLEREPILALGRSGLGRTAAFTVDLNAWAGEMGAWDALPGLLGTTVRWLQARPEPYGATARVEADEVRVVVDAVQGGEYLNGRELVARFAGEEVRLEQVAPGRYEGALPTSPAGGALLVVEGDRVRARVDVQGPDAELGGGDGGALLVEIARRSGGEVLAEGATWSPEPSRRSRPIWTWPALAALALLLVELVLRRFGRGGDGGGALRRSASS